MIHMIFIWYSYDIHMILVWQYDMCCVRFPSHPQIYHCHWEGSTQLGNLWNFPPSKALSIIWCWLLLPSLSLLLLLWRILVAAAVAAPLASPLFLPTDPKPVRQRQRHVICPVPLGSKRFQASWRCNDIQLSIQRLQYRGGGSWKSREKARKRSTISYPCILSTKRRPKDQR